MKVTGSSGDATFSASGSSRISDTLLCLPPSVLSRRLRSRRDGAEGDPASQCLQGLSERRPAVTLPETHTSRTRRRTGVLLPRPDTALPARTIGGVAAQGRGCCFVSETCCFLWRSWARSSRPSPGLPLYPEGWTLAHHLNH